MRKLRAVPLARKLDLDGDQVAIGHVAVGAVDGEGPPRDLHHRADHAADLGNAVLGAGNSVVAGLVPDDSRGQQVSERRLIARLHRGGADRGALRPISDRYRTLG